MDTIEYGRQDGCFVTPRQACKHAQERKRHKEGIEQLHMVGKTCLD